MYIYFTLNKDFEILNCWLLIWQTSLNLWLGQTWTLYIVLVQTELTTITLYTVAVLTPHNLLGSILMVSVLRHLNRNLPSSSSSSVQQFNGFICVPFGLESKKKKKPKPLDFPEDLFLDTKTSKTVSASRNWFLSE